MRELPRGTVTFLFTDVEGSTRLLKELGSSYGDVLAEHERILRRAFEAAGGQEIDTQGDSFFVAFRRAKDAVGAAVAAQRALAAHAWPGGADVRVRMGLHTGEPSVGSERYVGIGVHRAARIAAAGHGGQVLLSNTTRDLVEDELAPDVRLVDLGEHRLKDIDRPERIFQLSATGLPDRFPPLRLEAPLPRSRVWRRPARIPRERTLLAAAAALAVVAAVVGLAVAMGRHEANPAGDSLATSRAELAAPGQDPDTIIPGKSVGAVALGMTQADLETLYGRGQEKEWRSHGRTGSTRRYSGSGGVLSVSLYDRKVVQVATQSPYYVTSDGIRVGMEPPSLASPDEGAQRRWEAALRSGAAVQIAPGIYSWRGFVYGRESYCLMGDGSATQLVLRGPVIAHVVQILITDADFLMHLPARVTYSNTAYDLSCAPEASGS
jgi:class 3 adenylate cyclase